MPKVKLSKDEFEHMARLINRLFKHRESLSRQDGNKEKKSSYSLVKNFDKKLQGKMPVELEVVIAASRQEVRLMEGVLKGSIDILNSSTIPGYMKRIDEKNEPERHKEYMDKAVNLRDNILQQMLDKVQKAL